MPMLSYYGITELVGDSGSGKTAIAIEESKQFRTLYLTSTNFPIEKYDFSQNEYGNVYIEVIQSIGDLLYVLNVKIKGIENKHCEDSKGINNIENQDMQSDSKGINNNENQDMQCDSKSMNSINTFSVNFFELIVIDSLYQIVFVERRSTREITNIIYILKRLISKFKLKVLVLNSCCLRTVRSNRVSFLSKLGLNWEYHVNTKYRCLKQGDTRTLEMVKSPVNENLKINFRIKRTGLEVVV